MYLSQKHIYQSYYTLVKGKISNNNTSQENQWLHNIFILSRTENCTEMVCLKNCSWNNTGNTVPNCPTTTTNGPVTTVHHDTTRPHHHHCKHHHNSKHHHHKRPFHPSSNEHDQRQQNDSLRYVKLFHLFRSLEIYLLRCNSHPSKDEESEEGQSKVSCIEYSCICILYLIQNKD